MAIIVYLLVTGFIIVPAILFFGIRHGIMEMDRAADSCERHNKVTANHLAKRNKKFI